MKKKSMVEKAITKGLSIFIAPYLRKKYANMPKEASSLEEWEKLRAKVGRYFPYKHPLALHFDYDPMPIDGIQIPELKENLAGRTIGGWALDLESIHFYWDQLLETKPNLAIECGSGTSTILFATFFHKYGMEEARVISLEQSLDEKNRIEATLEKLGLAKYVEVYYVPITPEDNGYDFQKFAPKMLEKADFIIVDGPSGSRMSTMPNLKQYAKTGAVWYLDDALRDAEIAYLKAWSEDSQLGLKGIIPVGKGIGIGYIQ